MAYHSEQECDDMQPGPQDEASKEPSMPTSIRVSGLLKTCR